MITWNTLSCINSFISFKNGTVAVHKIGKIIPKLRILCTADIEVWFASNNVRFPNKNSHSKTIIDLLKLKPPVDYVARIGTYPWLLFWEGNVFFSISARNSLDNPGWLAVLFTHTGNAKWSLFWKVYSIMCWVIHRDFTMNNKLLGKSIFCPKLDNLRGKYR